MFKNNKIFSVWEQNGIYGNILDFDKIDAVVKPGKKDVTVKSYMLEQNYPNPFNPSTNISWQMPVSGHVVIKIYNVLGKEIETLADKDFSAGQHTLNWDASKYSSGVYFYKLNAGGYILTKKMLLIK